MAGIAGGCLAVEPISAGGDSVIRVQENINESVTFPESQGIVETISETVTVIVTWG